MTSGIHPLQQSQNSRPGSVFGAIGSAILLIAYVLVSPPDTLTAFPAVYHDDYVVSSPAVGVAERGVPHLAAHDATPERVQILGGNETDFVPGLNAGYQYTLGIVFRITGFDIRIARLFSWCFGLIIVGCIYVLIGLRLGWSYGLLAASVFLPEGHFWVAARTVRPETFTAAAYLVAAVALQKASTSAARRRTFLLLLGGLSFGIGLTGHPLGVVLAPLVLLSLFFDHGLRSGWRLFAAPAAVVLTLYLCLLGYYWSDVRVNLHLHDAQRSQEPLRLTDLLTREWARYQVVFFNAYEVALGGWLRLVSFGSPIVLVAGAFLLRQRDEEHKVRFFGMVGFAVVLGLVILSILAQDHNFLYLTHISILLSLGLAAAVYVLLALARTTTAGRRWTSAVPALLALMSLSGAVGSYHQENVAHAGVLPYEGLEQRFADELHSPSLLIGSESGWGIARRGGGTFLFSRQYLQAMPQYEINPVAKATVVEQGHLTDYRLDPEAIDTLHSRGIAVHYLVDMFDWGWNAYYPFGKDYARSYLQLLQQLEEGGFRESARLFTANRGFVYLYTYSPDGRLPACDDLWVEGVRYRVMPALANLETKGEGQLQLHVGEQTTVGFFDVFPGRPYWLRIRLALQEGEAIVPCWNGTGLPRYFDSRDPVSLDWVVTSTEPCGKVSLLPLNRQSTLRLEQVELLPLE